MPLLFPVNLHVEAVVHPPSETCNAIDDDCDYSVDELIYDISIEFPAPPVYAGTTINVITRYPAGVVSVPGPYILTRGIERKE